MKLIIERGNPIMIDQIYHTDTVTFLDYNEERYLLSCSHSPAKYVEIQDDSSTVVEFDNGEFWELHNKTWRFLELKEYAYID